MGVWIETPLVHFINWQKIVTPCMGVWIETTIANIGAVILRSHPVWVCGLKLALLLHRVRLLVTPCMGVWIETQDEAYYDKLSDSHTLYGCVD